MSRESTQLCNVFRELTASWVKLWPLICNGSPSLKFMRRSRIAKAWSKLVFKSLPAHHVYSLSDCRHCDTATPSTLSSCVPDTLFGNLYSVELRKSVSGTHEERVDGVAVSQ